MNDGLLALRRAKKSATASSHRFVLWPNDMRAAVWTDGRHHKAPCIKRALFHNHAYHFRDDVPCPAHAHRVTDMHVFSSNLVLVVQGSVGYRYPTNKNRG